MPIQIRVEAEDLGRWQSCADKSGLSLSEWMRRRCNGEGHLLPAKGGNDGTVQEGEEHHGLAGLPADRGIRVVEQGVDTPERIAEVVSQETCGHGATKNRCKVIMLTKLRISSLESTRVTLNGWLPFCV